MIESRVMEVTPVKRSTFFLTVLVVIMIVILSAFWWGPAKYHTYSLEREARNCKAAGTNEACVPADFLRDEDDIKTMQDELSTKELRDKVDHLTGALQRVDAEIPKGWAYDRQKRRLVMVPLDVKPQTSPAAAAPATAAPSATQPATSVPKK